LTVSHEQLAEAARQAAQSRARAERLERCVKTFIEQTDLKVGSHRVVGRSEEWLKVLRTAVQVASTDTTVLLSGESGTGKEVIARLIHEASNRRDGPFVALNCAALAESLLESELFGYERGAFTDAHQAKPGPIELATRGGFFLDEVSEMSLAAQAKFLRVLQEREFQRLGGTRMRKADVRLIAATNRDLGKAVECGRFREDLYYRIQVFDIRMPPLRDRKEDVLILCDAFLEEIGIAHGRPSARLTLNAEAALLRYDWPGNVPELHNVLERAAILSDGAPITARHLSLRTERVAAGPTTDLTIVERQTIEQVMRDTGWNKSKAAKRLGLSRTQLYGRLRKYVLKEPAYASAEQPDFPTVPMESASSPVKIFGAPRSHLQAIDWFLSALRASPERPSPHRPRPQKIARRPGGWPPRRPSSRGRAPAPRARQRETEKTDRPLGDRGLVEIPWPLRDRGHSA